MMWPAKITCLQIRLEKVVVFYWTFKIVPEFENNRLEHYLKNIWRLEPNFCLNKAKNIGGATAPSAL